MAIVTYANPPEKCDVCGDKIVDEFVDGKTRIGPWANMCMECFDVHGIGFGTGKGQKFRKGPDGKFHKVIFL